MKWTTIAETRMATTAPPSSPSQLLLGLTEGASWWRPMAAPMSSEPTSSATVTMMAARTKAIPWRSGNRLGLSSSAAKDPKAPTHTNTNTVEEMPDTGSAAGSTRARYQTKEPATSNTSTSGNAATPLLYVSTNRDRTATSPSNVAGWYWARRKAA